MFIFQNESNEADVPSEENQPGAEKTEDSDQRQMEKVRILHHPTSFI